MSTEAFSWAAGETPASGRYRAAVWRKARRFVPKEELAALLPRRIVDRIEGVASGAPIRLVDTR